MLRIAIIFLFLFSAVSEAKEPLLKQYKIESSIPGLSLCLFHIEGVKQQNQHQQKVVLFVHGSTFPTQLAAGFNIENTSWLEYLNQDGFDVWALDFLGYGCSDRYPEMEQPDNSGQPIGSASEVVHDLDKAVEFILKDTKQTRLSIVSHSRGGIVSGLYAETYPEKVAKLVFFAPIIERKNIFLDPIIRTLRIKKPNVLYLDITPEDRINGFNKEVPNGFDPVLEQEVLDGWGEKWLASDATKNHSPSDSIRVPAGFRSDFYNTWTGNGHVNYDQIKAPTLIIRGAWDTYSTERDAKYMLKELTIAQTEYFVIANATHAAHLEKNRFSLFRKTSQFIREDN